MTMKQLTKILQALLGVAALIITALVAAGRLAWHTICKRWKKQSKRICRSIIATVVVVIIGFATLLAYEWYDSEYGRYKWRNESLSKNVIIHYFRDYKYRVYNKSTGEYTTPKVNWVSGTPGNDSLTVYALPCKRGYINANTGEIVIDAESNDYRKAWVFSEGVAAVMKDGKIGFINSKNEVVIPFRFDYSEKERAWNFGYLFHNGYCIMTNKDGELGLIDTNGEWVVEPTYDKICMPDEKGYRTIVNDDKFGLLDAKCNVVYPAEYEDIVVLSNGFILAKGGKKWQEDIEGNIVHNFMYDYTYYLNYPIGYNDCGVIQYAFSDYLKYVVMNGYGIMNRITGEPITPAIYSEINMLSKNLFEVQDPESHDWYMLYVDGTSVRIVK